MRAINPLRPTQRPTQRPTLPPPRMPLAIVAGLIAGLFALPQSAEAIPVFARKYETSCQTCHTAFPKLNPFGEAFRRNGYRMPGADEEGASQDEPIALGHKIHRKLFPNAVLPGDIPGGVPLAMGLMTGFKLTNEIGEGHHGAPVAVKPETKGGDHEGGGWGLEFGKTEVNLYTAGTMGKMISWFGKLGMNSSGEVEVERPNVIFRPFETPSMLIKVGSFEPGLQSFSVHRNLTGHELFTTTATFGGNTWAPEPQQNGVEFSGILASGRLGYVAGVVEGSSNFANGVKDAYGRVDYKIGGMRLDGIGGATSSSPWSEWSVLIGGYGYSGQANIGPVAGSTLTGQQRDGFWRAGFDVNAMLGDLNVVVNVFQQSHSSPTFGNSNSGSLRGIYSQADYVIWPWLVATGRYERFDQIWPDATDGTAGDTGSAQRVSFGANALLRANISIRVMARMQQNPGDGMEFDGGELALATVF